MMMRAKPYIGISSPVTIEEVNSLCQEFESAGYTMGTRHIPMIGITVSHETLNGQPGKNKRYPVFSEVPKMLEAAGDNVLTMIHYDSRQEDTLAEQLINIFSKVSCRAVQLNIPWPDVQRINKVKSIFPDLKIVLQLSREMMQGRTPDEIANKMSQYGDSISYVLIDPSGGSGISIAPQDILPIFLKLRGRTNLTLGFAGGFGGDNVGERVQQLINLTGTDMFCIDAESGLRDKLSDSYGDDILNIDKARSYLQAASKILK